MSASQWALVFACAAVVAACTAVPGGPDGVHVPVAGGAGVAELVPGR